MDITLISLKEITLRPCNWQFNAVCSSEILKGNQYKTGHPCRCEVLRHVEFEDKSISSFYIGREISVNNDKFPDVISLLCNL